MRDMLEVVNDAEQKDGTEEHPILLSDDKSRDWELLLASFYRKYDHFVSALNPVPY
jgi:hypothetical protein